MFNLSTAEPDDFDHYPFCASNDTSEPCNCDEIERKDRLSFAANVADWKNDDARCY